MGDFAPLRDNLVRALPGGLELRSSDDSMPTLVGHLAVFDRWTEIDSVSEGHFMERIAPGAFKRTFTNNRDKIKVLFNHGKDPQIANKVLGPIELLEEDDTGARYEVPLLDTSYNRDLAPGIKAGLYGSSFRFSVVKQAKNDHPMRSVENPQGIPERTVTEAHVYEFGPVTFPQYPAADAGLRSMTDSYIYDELTRDPDRFAELVESMRSTQPEALPEDGPEAEPHSEPETRSELDPPDELPTRSYIPDPPEGGSSVSQETDDVSDPVSRVDRPALIKELRSLVESFTTEHTGVLSSEQQGDWDAMTSQLRSLEADEKADALRRAFVADRANLSTNIEDEHVDVPAASGSFTVSNPGTIRRAPKVRDIYSMGEIRAASDGAESESQLLRESALRAIEEASFAHMDRSTGQTAVEKTLKETDDRGDYIAKRILLTGNPIYRRALHKTLMNQMLTAEEMGAYSRFQDNERAMGQVTGSAGGFGVTFDLDPTMIQTSNGAVVPYRRAARVVSITTNEWRGVTSGGVVAAYAAEAAVSTDNSPTLAQPAALVQKAHCFVPFSMEIQGDYAGLEGELGREIQDAKDVLEAVQFTTGAGTTVFPQGIVTGSTNASTTATTLVLAAADLYATEFNLAPRFRQNARWFANRAFYNRIRAIDTAGGAQLWTQNLTVGLDNNKEGNTGYRLLGYPAEECSGFSTSIASTTKMAVFGDPNYFVVVDRVGLNLELVPILTQQAVAGTGFGFPTGQRGIYAWWRNTSKVLSATAFLTVTGL